MPESKQNVHQLFHSYVKSGLPKSTIRPSAKPTLEKKLATWEKSKVEMEGMELFLDYFRSDQGPKQFASLQRYMKEHPERDNAPKFIGNKIGKYTDPKRFKIGDSKDMVPMVYPDSMQPDPIIVQLHKEHEDIVKRHSYNPGEKFTEIARQYYEEKQA